MSILRLRSRRALVPFSISSARRRASCCFFTGRCRERSSPLCSSCIRLMRRWDSLDGPAFTSSRAVALSSAPRSKQCSQKSPRSTPCTISSEGYVLFLAIGVRLGREKFLSRGILISSAWSTESVTSDLVLENIQTRDRREFCISSLIQNQLYISHNVCKCITSKNCYMEQPYVTARRMTQLMHQQCARLCIGKQVACCRSWSIREQFHTCCCCLVPRCAHPASVGMASDFRTEIRNHHSERWEGWKRPGVAASHKEQIAPCHRASLTVSCTASLQASSHTAPGSVIARMTLKEPKTSLLATLAGNTQ
mmetsp:Transcript_18457/g.60604  ORF Transcript_18457/g.60604 Transcript_18457/m.60604 type:complete len:308 (-) Transcript_18457:520-1443(-)